MYHDRVGRRLRGSLWRIMVCVTCSFLFSSSSIRLLYASSLFRFFIRVSFLFFFSICPSVRSSVCFFFPTSSFSFYPPIKLDSLCRNGPLGQKNLSSLRSASFPQLIFSSHLFLFFRSPRRFLMGNTYRRHKITWTNVSFVLFVPNAPGQMLGSSSIAECCGENEPERNDPTLAPSNLSQLILLVTTQRPAGPSDSWLVIHDKCHIDTDITAERERKTFFPPPTTTKQNRFFFLYLSRFAF